MKQMNKPNHSTVQYKICTGQVEVDRKYIEYLEEEVNEMLAKGWKLQGGVSVRTGAQSGAYFLQAMVKDEPSTDK